MATEKPISGFPLITGTDLEPGDLLVVVDVSNTSTSPSGTTSSVALGSVLNNPQNGIITGKITPIRATPAAGQIVNAAQNGMVFRSSGGTLTDYSFLDVGGAFIFGGRANDSALLGGKFSSVSVVPTVAPLSNAGTGATASVVGSNTCGVVTLNTGTGAAAGTQFTITFSDPYTGAAVGVVGYGGTAALLYPVLSVTTTVFGLTVRALTSALTDSSTYQFNYQVMGYGN